MKNILLTILLLLPFITYSQKVGGGAFAINPFHEAKVETRSGEIIEGVARLNLNNEIVFKEDIDADKIFYNYKTAKSVDLTIEGEQKKYAYKIVDGVAYPHAIKLLEVFTEGNVILYFKKKTTTDAFAGQNFANEMSQGVNNSVSNNVLKDVKYTNFDYYLGVPGQDLVTDLRNGNTYSKRFKTIAKNYFSDCSDLMNKIKSKYFKRYEIRSIVNYYNNDCQ